MSNKIRVAICGGGIVGATLANLLMNHEDKIEFQVYEAAKEFKEIGAGLGLWARAMKVFREASPELYKACYDIAAIPDPSDPHLAFKARVANRKPNGYEFGQWRFENGPVMFHRAHLLDVLVEKLPKDKLHFGKRLASYENIPVVSADGSTDGRQEVVLHFVDGTSARVDLLIGADGIKSTVRRQMFMSHAAEENLSIEEVTDKHIEPAWSGSVAYRSLIPVEELRKVNPNHSIFKAPQQYFGLDKHLIVFLIDKTYINMVAFVSDYSKVGTRYPDEHNVKDVTQEELLKSFEDFEDEAQEMFKLMPKPSLWAINSLKETLPFLASNNVALVGDAAHAMTPHLGIGAGMGIEDTSVITHFITSPHINPSNIHLALQAFNTARVRNVADVLRRAAAQGRLYEYRLEGVGRDTEKIQEYMKQNTEHILRWKAEDDIKTGLEWIEKQVTKTPTQ